MRRCVYKGEPPADDIKFSDDKVCKSFIMGLCPHALFNNTVSILLHRILGKKENRLKFVFNLVGAYQSVQTIECMMEKTV